MHMAHRLSWTGHGSSRPRTGAARAGAAALALALIAGPVAAQEPVPEAAEGLIGLWHRDDVFAVRIEPDRLVHIGAEGQWVHSAERCADVFEHAFGTATRAELLAEYDTPDFADPYGTPLGGRLDALLPEDGGPFATLRSACCCPTEIPNSAQYVLLDDDTVLSVVYGDGVFALDTLHAAVPPPSHDGLAADERRRIQAELRRRGHYAGAIDADFGPATTAAIEAFQRSIGAEPTGVLARSQVIRLLFDDAAQDAPAR